MHQYLIFQSIPSTAPLYGKSGLNTDKKMRVLGIHKATNSHKVCDEVASRLDIPYHQLKACLVQFDKNGIMHFEAMNGGYRRAQMKSKK